MLHPILLRFKRYGQRWIILKMDRIRSWKHWVLLPTSWCGKLQKNKQAFPRLNNESRRWATRKWVEERNAPAQLHLETWAPWHQSAEKNRTVSQNCPKWGFWINNRTQSSFVLLGPFWMCLSKILVSTLKVIFKRLYWKRRFMILESK